ncbi:MAG: carbohydrate binding family 9 domain-containing protein, partial [bacterium]|nr:carbohydrate binding family 9 domain-containing protein [bacterium]
MRQITLIVLIILMHISGYAQENAKKITAVSTDERIILDGNLTEPAWETALPITGFTQRELQEGENATEKTEVRVIYDDENIYVGVVCYDSEPDKIINKELKRDGSIDADDNIAIVLDTYRDFRGGFYFETNPNGARGDGLITNQEHINKDWNGVWDVGATISDYGWSVEIIIPIKTLRFPNKEESVWGFNVRRKIKRKEEEVLWLSWRRNNGLMQLSEAGLLTGLNNIKMRQKIELKPYALGGSEKTITSSSNSFEYGLDAKYPISSNLVLDLTANTDFAQVEADRNQINLTRFSIKYPEKREFFLEGSDIFKFGLKQADVFYTRRIGITPDRKQVPILGGARLSGKIGDYRIGMLNMQTDRKNGTPSTNYSVLSIKKDVLEKSSIGFMATNLYSDGGHDNQALGVDFLYNTSSFRGNNNIIAGAAVSGTLTDGKGKDNIAGTVFFDYPNDQEDHYFEYSVIP